MTASRTKLESLTTEFFSRHWNTSEIKSPPPVWSERYIFIGSLPSYDKQGVYAFITAEGEVTYIGVGTAKGGGRYKGHGLGARFQAYTRVINDAHSPTDDRLKEAGGIITIGFEPEYAYIANALELFLINRLNPKYNINKPGG
jgi:excinuclease UvrABC nuclease subunit